MLPSLFSSLSAVAMAAGAAVPQHRHQGEGESGPGGDKLRLATRHPHHHTALAHARGTPETPDAPMLVVPNWSIAGVCFFIKLANCGC